MDDNEDDDNENNDNDEGLVLLKCDFKVCPD